MELLQRQRQGNMTTKIQHCSNLNGGLFADGQTHPFTTTPLLKTRFGKMGAAVAQRSNLVFDIMLKPLYGKEYRSTKLTKQELRETEKAIVCRTQLILWTSTRRTTAAGTWRNGCKRTLPKVRVATAAMAVAWKSALPTDNSYVNFVIIVTHIGTV